MYIVQCTHVHTCTWNVHISFYITKLSTLNYPNAQIAMLFGVQQTDVSYAAKANAIRTVVFSSLMETAAPLAGRGGQV